MCDIGQIDLYYGDETNVSTQGYVPYGWQFPNEEICIPSERKANLTCFGLWSRTNQQLFYKLLEKTTTAQFILETLEEFSFLIQKPTVIVLDNARIHTAKKVLEAIPRWRNRNLYIFFLPPYSPHLNRIERLWKEIKEGWIRPQDYIEKDSLFYAIDRICANVGHILTINFNI